MAEPLADPSPERPAESPDPALLDALRKLDRANIKKVGAFHFTMAMAALTLWGAATAWAQTTGWLVAEFAALANAVIAGTVLASLSHEWGHFAGARRAGAVSPVLEAPRNHFFMFDFKMDENDVDQFVSMSWGGILAPWIVVALALVFVPLGLVSGAALVATLVSKAVAAARFEVPIVRAAERHGDPKAALGDAIQQGTLEASRPVGLAAGAAVFAILWLFA